MPLFPYFMQQRERMPKKGVRRRFLKAAFARGRQCLSLFRAPRRRGQVRNMPESRAPSENRTDLRRRKRRPRIRVQDMGHLPCRTAVRLRSSAFPTDMNASRSGQQNAPEIPKTFPFSNVFSIAKESLHPHQARTCAETAALPSFSGSKGSRRTPF